MLGRHSLDFSFSGIKTAVLLPKRNACFRFSCPDKNLLSMSPLNWQIRVKVSSCLGRGD